jgi:prepilin-type N-terminal cleavage/methylation domain-containing protein/prepilin-type processing-associated H-X9-DG protein
MRNRKAFTLIELLVVIAIIAILAAILFPVFAAAKQAAKKISCLANFNQVTKSMMMYMGDHDDGLPHANQGSINGPGWGFGRPDYVWGELIYSYVQSYYVFRCPADPNATDQGLSMDPNDRPADKSDPSFYYYWLSRTDLGYNYDFLSPWITRQDPGGTYVGSAPINAGRIAQPGATILFGDSMWLRKPNGDPTGGGNWVIEAPCVRDENQQFMEPIPDYTGNGNNGRWQTYGVGWCVGCNPNDSNYWLEWGGLYPYHSKQVNIAFVDGHTKTMRIGNISAGCDVRRNFQGLAYDGDQYLWDLR